MKMESEPVPQAKAAATHENRGVDLATPPVAVKAPPVRRSPLRVLIPLVLFIGAVVGYYYYRNLGHEETDDAQVTADMVPVGTRVAGQIVKVHIRDNQIVKKGALIAELDAADYAAHVKQAEAELATAQAQLAVSRESKQAAETRVREGRGRLNQSAPIDAQLATAEANAALAAARVRSAEAMLELAKLQLSYTKLSAPTDGTASKLTVREGQLVSAGQPIVELVPTETYVVANFKETQIGRMSPGQTATIHIDAFPGRVFSGRVESLSGGTGASFSLLPADNASGNFVKVVQRVPVRVAWLNRPEGLQLRAGLSAEVRVEVGR
jgi:membrane fusion protein (multidrug efflux system)